MFRRGGDSQRSKHFRARVESCVNTILELNNHLGEGKIRPEVIKQFLRLKESLRHVSDENVSEQDVTRIEQATNQLLEEIRAAYGDQKPLVLHDGDRH
ncbi:hypothetical protein [Desulfosoma sp.]|jgi:hypothetical protein|uniref:Uncharacterized protein n=1 Tax=Desulfacinum infernum TaxID=35837 RepID=A0A831ZRH2_9BACT